MVCVLCMWWCVCCGVDVVSYVVRACVYLSQLVELYQQSVLRVLVVTHLTVTVSLVSSL